jgi:NAD(P)-dependent dehydrogenase (short-subunit alcohol dehydrogenase family)
MSYWRDRAKAGQTVRASLIHTTSIAAFAGSFGQANYSAAKMAIVGLSRVAALEGERYGVRSNAVSPSARTRIGMQTPGADTAFGPPGDAHAFDRLDPANVSPLIAWLAAADCPATAQVFHTYADRLIVVSMPSIVHDLRTLGPWTLEALDRELSGRLLSPPRIADFLELEEQVEA